MPSRRRRLEPGKRSQFTIDLQSGQPQQQQPTYREQALAMFPHVCARCGREFGGKNLRELTVHHKDSDHMNNPPDGSNWELLCLYCHDEEHQKLGSGGYQGKLTRETHKEADLGFRPFEGLGNLLKPEEDPDPEQ
jgi:hypothetical protein